MPRIIAIANRKGGVGKTTTTVNVATAMAAAGKKVLVVDLDPQGNATTSMGVNKSGRMPSSYEVLLGEKRINEAQKLGFKQREMEIKRLEREDRNIE